MRVLVIVKNLTGGGAERVATNLAGCLEEYVEKVVLAVLNGSDNTYGSTVETIDLNMPEDKGILKFSWHLKVMKKIKAIKKKYGITHSISFMAEPDLANILSKGKDKTIVSVRNNRSAVKQNILLYKKNKWVFNKADAIVALSKKVGEDMADLYGVNKDVITCIYNPCYTDTIQKKISEGVITTEENKLFRENRGRVVITAGRLTNQKGQWHLIRAFSHVVRTIPEAKLIILGQGEKREYLQQLINDLNLGENVKLWGYKSNPYPYLAEADVFAFPSIYEGLGNILIECMACELPIISTDCKFGPKELLDPDADLNSYAEEIRHGKYGILVPPMTGKEYTASDPLQQSEKYLSDAIIEMLSNNVLREHYKVAARERGKDFLPSEITRQWLEVLKNM